jgi:hypothetical protein
MVELTGRIKLNVDQAVEMIIVEYIITVGSKSLVLYSYKVRLEQMILEVL